MITFLFIVYFVVFIGLYLLIVSGITFVITKVKQQKEGNDPTLKFNKDYIIDLLLIELPRKELFKCLLLGFIFATIIAYKPIYAVGKCQVLSRPLNSRTAFSLVMGECTVQTKTGAYIPVRILRDSPEGDSNDAVF